MDHTSYRASILLLTAMSLDRVLATVYLIETRVYRTRKNASKVCWVIWLVSLASSFYFFLYSKVIKVEDIKVCGLSFPGTEVTDDENELEKLINDSTTEDVYYDESVVYSAEYSSSDLVYSGFFVFNAILFKIK